jgi:hypothetical protein
MVGVHGMVITGAFMMKTMKLFKSKVQKARAKKIMQKAFITEQMKSLRKEISMFQPDSFDYYQLSIRLTRLSERAIRLENEIELLDNPMKLIKISNIPTI